MKTPEWQLEVRFRRFFENQFEFRARDKVGAVKDRILRGAFAGTVLQAFTVDEVKDAIKYGIIKGDQIATTKGHRNVYLWLEKECQYQPIWYKRQLKRFKDWFSKTTEFLRLHT